MPIAFDFGTSNTVLARSTKEGKVELLSAPEVSRSFDYVLPGSDTPQSVSVSPSVIHYAQDEVLLGSQVQARNLLDDPASFRWLKMDMLRQNSRARRIGERRIAYREAATTLVSRLFMFLLEANAASDDELVVTVPVECYDSYVEWLSESLGKVYPRNIQFVDEATACILGHNEVVSDGDFFLIVDFGGGTLDVSLVKTDFEAGGERKCRILGRSGEEIGGMMIDQWMLQELRLDEDEIRVVGHELLRAIEEAKIALTYEDTAGLSVYSPASDRLLTHQFSRAAFDAMLQENRFFELVVTTIDRALEEGLSRYGTSRSDIKQVLLVGGTSLIPAVREQMEHLFPGKIRYGNPFTAIAEGACRFVKDEYSPLIVHDYCLRAWDRELRQDSYTPIVEKGTRYPTPKPVKAMYINASHEAQNRLGLLIYEISAMARLGTSYVVSSGGQLELSDESRRRIERQQPLNPENSEFIIADPPCTRGERRFLASFGVDEEKRLTISLQDTRSDNASRIVAADGKEIPLPISNYPVVRLAR